MTTEIICPKTSKPCDHDATCENFNSLAIRGCSILIKDFSAISPENAAFVRLLMAGLDDGSIVLS